MSRSDVRATFVSPVDLLERAIEALTHDPEDAPVEVGHPQDSYYAARNALDVVAGMFIAETQKAYQKPRTQ